MTTDHRRPPRRDPPLTAAQEAELRALIVTEADARAAILTPDDVQRLLGHAPPGPRPPSAGALRQRRYMARKRAARE